LFNYPLQSYCSAVVVACTDYGCVAPCLANILQNVRFWAASLASGSPMSKGERSSVMFRIQVERGRPGSLLQFSGSCSNRTRLASADSSIRARCPNRESRRDLTVDERGGCSVNRRTSSFRTKSFQRMSKILRRHHWSVASILRASALVTVQHSDPYNIIGRI